MASKTIITKLNLALQKVLLDPVVKLGLEKASIEPLGLSAENASIFIAKENDKWGRVIKVAGIKAE